jgi:regulatory protein
MGVRRKTGGNSPENENKIKAAEAAMARYCSYQERTVNQVMEKLAGKNIDDRNSGKIIEKLVQEGFINEERYAVSFMLGKFRQNKWGKNKIRYALRNKGIDDRLIELAAEQIDSDEYSEQIRTLVRKKASEIKSEPYVKKNKIANFLIGKGFEPDLVWGIIREEIKNLK